MAAVKRGISDSTDELVASVSQVSAEQLARIAGRIDAYNAILLMEIE